MSHYGRRPPKAPSRRAVRNTLAIYQALHDNTTPVIEQPSVKRGPQPEGETNKAVAQWRKLKPDLLLERNKRRLATPPGMTAPIMLGWLADGSPDWIGYHTTVVTPSMVGQRVAIFVGLEAKRPDGTGKVSKEQEAFLNALKDAGGVSGVVCNAEDAEAAVQRWFAKVAGDER